ncbi:TPA: hypothetical protein NO005_002692 [Pseudomonas aeruginosa]|nr:hypothetical protein [Pseudomonas aeruginosa]HCH7697187.1 hypothetical protein [Pseudomonas aeruginosa]HCH7763632.1 hypothetical protein [Pseudomonas aeruginosa]HCI3516377.1 hypothetical protein [Pseudomonas aeruginosa]HCI7130596.1 hypothetical protein [Pseudomonas aeruginosa]
MSEVKRYHFESFIDSYYKHRQFVLASDYDTLAAEAQALREERDSQQRVAIKAMEELAALRARVVVVPERKSGQSTIPGLHMNRGWNACLDELSRLNGLTVSEGLLRRLARPADRYDEVFTLDRHEAAEELRALLSEQA